MPDIWGQKSLLDKKRQEDQPDVYNALPSENEGMRNKLVDVLGLPDTLKMTNKDEEQLRENLPMQMGMAGMGTIGKADQAAQGFGKVLMQAPAAKGLGKVIMQPTLEEQMGNTTSQNPEFFNKIKELLSKQGK